MAQATAIGWTDLSWNPVLGCSIVSTECKNCYAAATADRWGLTPSEWTPANAAENVILKPHKLREPLSGAKAWQGLGAAAAAAGKTDGQLVFVNSMSDLFHEQIPVEYIGRVFNVMAEANRHTFQILTKRPDRMRDVVTAYYDTFGLDPLPNVWLGVSIGLRHFVGRADLLRQTPAAVRFISAEPLLGPLVHDRFALAWPGVRMPTWNDGSDRPGLDLTGIDWLIVGGESGKGHRPMDPQWARDLRDACVSGCSCSTLDVEGGADHVHRPAFFFKQHGGARPMSGGRELDGRTWDEFPRAAA